MLRTNNYTLILLFSFLAASCSAGGTKSSYSDRSCKVHADQTGKQLIPDCELESGNYTVYNAGDRKYRGFVKCKQRQCACLSWAGSFEGGDYSFIPPIYRNETIKIYFPLHGGVRGVRGDHKSYEEQLSMDVPVKPWLAELTFNADGLVREQREILTTSGFVAYSYRQYFDLKEYESEREKDANFPSLLTRRFYIRCHIIETEVFQHPELMRQ